MKYQFLRFLTTICFWIMLDACGNKKESSGGSLEMESQSLEVLRNVLATQSEWVKVHAAEYLIWSGNPEGVQAAYLQEEKLFGTKSPYRIGIWRVLAQAASNETDRKMWTDKIMAVFLDSTATDRTHAVETLAKLKISPLANDRHLTEETLNSPVKSLALYTLWSIAFTSRDSLKTAPGKFLDVIIKAGGDPSGKSTPAYALRQLKGLSDKEWDLLAATALAEPADSPARVYLLSAAFTTVNAGRQPEALPTIHAEILKYKSAASKGDISEMCAALADRGTEKDLSMLDSLSENLTQLTSEADKADVRAATAHAILKIMGRGGE
jgi:hypothetical protein